MLDERNLDLANFLFIFRAAKETFVRFKIRIQLVQSHFAAHQLSQ